MQTGTDSCEVPLVYDPYALLHLHVSLSDVAISSLWDGCFRARQ